MYFESDASKGSDNQCIWYLYGFLILRGKIKTKEEDSLFFSF